MPDVHGKPDYAYAYTPPTKKTAYGPDTSSMDWDKSSTAKSEARMNQSFKTLGETSNDTVGDIRGNEAVKDITNTGRNRDVIEAVWPKPGSGTTEDPIAGRGG